MIMSRRMRLAGHVAGMREKKITYRMLMGKPEGKRAPRSPRRRCVDIKMFLREIGWGSVDWFDVAQDTDQYRALVNTVMNLPVP
jgi:hypothetical protein